MTSGSSLSKARLAALVAGISALLGSGASALGGDWRSAGLALVAVIGVAAALWSLRLIEVDLRRAAETCRAVAGGDFERRTVGIGDSGLVGELLWAVNDLVDRTDAFVREAAASMEAVREHRYHRRIMEGGLGGGFRHAARTINGASAAMAGKIAEFRKATGEFETSIQRIAEGVASAATELQATAASMSGTATRTSEQATMAAAAAEETSANVQTVASAAEQLSASVTEISEQVSTSSRIAMSAVEEAERADSTVASLAEAAEKIGTVVNLIDNIAHQTNLLALNATIEAARAGEAGKGFAVVASEVKNLATQTARATGEITEQIAGMQAATRGAVQAIQSIGRTITEIETITGGIAAAIEQQGAATKEIARNVEQASAGTGGVSENVQEVTGGAAETGHAASEVLTAASDLSRQAERLQSEVGGFLETLRRVA